MKILIVNDDGIKAKGIIKLAECAKAFGDVWVVGPAEQCSAMSHRITVGRPLTVRKVDFPVEGIVGAYSVDGTPADCVKAGVEGVIPGGPDIVFSGINIGYNAGVDILYSGTVGAAMDALIYGIPAIAYSTPKHSDYKVVEEYFYDVTKELIDQGLSTSEIFNVNFPAGDPKDIQGVKKDCLTARIEYYLDRYEKIEGEEEDVFLLKPHERDSHDVEEGTDIRALLDGFISIGKIGNGVL